MTAPACSSTGCSSRKTEPHGMETIRWGIVGAGNIAGRFAADFAHVPNGSVVAVASRSMDRATAFARRLEIPRAYDSYEALCEDPGIDAVYVATPHSRHAADATMALRGGKAVLCEKPITTTPDEARALFAVAEATGGYLMEAMWTYFLPAIKQAQAWVEEGRVGRIRHVRADFGYPVPYDPRSRAYNPDLAGGALLDMGIYPVAFAWLFLQQDPTHLHVVSRNAPNGVDDDVTALFDYGDAAAALATSFRCTLPNYGYVIGEDGYIALPDFWQARECTLYRRHERIDHFVDTRQSEGFNFEAIAVGNDLLAGRKQSTVVPWNVSLRFQQHMARIRAHF